MSILLFLFYFSVLSSVTQESQEHPGNSETKAFVNDTTAYHNVRSTASPGS